MKKTTRRFRMKTIIFGLFAIAASMIVPVYADEGEHASGEYVSDPGAVALVAIVQKVRE